MATARNTKIKPPTNPKAPIPAIRVVSRAPSAEFRRGGQVWFHEERTVPLSEFTEEQLEAVRDEPLLVVNDTEIAPAADAAA